MQNKQLSWPQRGRVWLRLCIRLLGSALIVWLLWMFGKPLLSLFMPFILALAAAALLDPVVRLLQKRLGWARKWVALVLLVVLVAGIGGALALLLRAGVREVASLAENWDSLLAGFLQGMDRTEQLLENLMERLPFRISISDQSLLEWLGQWLSQWLSSAGPDIGNVTGFAAARAKAVVGFVVALIVFLTGTYFLSADFPYLRTAFVRRVDESSRIWLEQMRKASLGAFGGYLRAQLLLSIGVFFILLCGFLIAGQSYALLLALGFAMLDFIPLIGSGTIMVPWAIIDLFLGNYSHALALMIIWGLIVLFRRLSEPKFVGDQTGLSPILSLISIYVGMRLYGVWGMILCPILLLVLMNLVGLGLFSDTRRDIKLAISDLFAILRSGREENL